MAKTLHLKKEKLTVFPLKLNLHNKKRERTLSLIWVITLFFLIASNNYYSFALL
jgi:hypothetical protein